MMAKFRKITTAAPPAPVVKTVQARGISLDIYAFLAELGGGNASEGVRIAIERAWQARNLAEALDHTPDTLIKELVRWYAEDPVGCQIALGPIFGVKSDD